MDEKSSRYQGEFTEQETKKRADAALRNALNMRPKPHSESKIGKPSRKKAGSPKRRSKRA